MGEYKIEYMRGSGPGGQHRNKTDSACRVTHIATGITAYCDERSQHTSKRKAMKEVQRRIREAKSQQRAETKKSDRDRKISPGGTPTIRTYHYPRQTVKDHRTGKTLPLQEVLGKGRFIELQPRETAKVT
ncbi:MAG: peptide chain release factor-like protein [Planctomycetota bacterium]